MIRKQRDQALHDFQLVDEMPFCPEEYDMENLTSALNNVVVRRVDRNLYVKKQRRLNSNKVIEKKPIDDAVVKALLRFSGTIQDCLASYHQIKIVTNKAATMKINRTVRESKAQKISLKKIKEETQRRTELRQDRIQRTVEKHIEEAAAREMAAREEVERKEKQKEREEKIKYAEDEMLRITQYEEGEYNKKIAEERTAKKAQIEQRRKYQKADIQKSLEQLRNAMDQLDSAADAMLHRRFIFE